MKVHGSSEVQGGGEEVVAGGENGLLNKWIARDEVELPLDNLKWNTAPGADGLMAEMIYSKVLVET